MAEDLCVSNGSKEDKYMLVARQRNIALCFLN